MGGQKTLENFLVESAGKVLKETLYVVQNARSGYAKHVMRGFGIDWNWLLGFSALTALKERL